MSRFIVGTAGHIDHGKTTLIKALTGIGTDRLIEEQKRGISIVNGYAFLPYKDELISIIDVPGHEKFIKNMLSGITAIDLVLFVVAADEGVMPQTREHFDIVRLLGIEKGMFLITKVDRNLDMAELVREDIQDLVKGTLYETFPIVEVSAMTGLNLEVVKQFVFDHYEQKQEYKGYYPRLNIDRLFKGKGFGDIVTGSLEGADLSIDQPLIQLPGEERYKIRSIETHDTQTSLARIHSRVALNLVGEKKDALRKGAVLTVEGKYFSSKNALCDLMVLPEHAALLRSNETYKVYFGSSEHLGKLIQIEEEVWELLLDEAILMYHGQKAILRSLSPVRTIGRLIVLDANPLQGKRQKKASAQKIRQDHLTYVLDKYPAGITAEELERELVIPVQDIDFSAYRKLGQRYITEVGLKRWQQRMEHVLTQYYAQEKLSQWMEREAFRIQLGELPREAFDQLVQHFVQNGLLEVQGNKVKRKDKQVQIDEEQARLMQEILDEFEAYDLEVPNFSEIQSKYDEKKRRIFKYLVDKGELIRINNELYVKNTCIKYLKNDIIGYIMDHGSMEIKDFRELRDLSRKYIVPYLEYFDRSGVTRRQDNKRILTKEYING